MEDETLLAVILSVVFPGLGQLIKGETGKGIAFMVGFILSIPVGLVLAFILIGFFIPPAIWILSIVDAAQEE